MKHFHSVFFAILCFVSCNGQQSKETMKTSQDIYSIGNQVKHFDKEPHYGAYISTNNCSFDILINDIPIIKYLDNSGSGLSGSYFPLNWDITKAGKQKITIRLKPGYNQSLKSLNKTLQANSGVQIQIVKSYIVNKSFGDEFDVKNYQTPQKEFNGKQVAVYEGQNLFEDSFEFDSDVPYHITNLDNAEVLYSKDKDKLQTLEKEIVSKYNEIRDIYLKGTKDDLANISYSKEKRFSQQLYQSSPEIKYRWDTDYQFRTDNNLEFFDLKPIENYKMTFYGNGKLVCLEKINNQESSLWGGFKRKGEDQIITTYILIYLYRPNKGSKLEIY